MKNALLIVLPTCASDAPLAERLLDWCFELHGRQPRGHGFIACASDVHPEMMKKLEISAQLAFETFTVTQAKASDRVRNSERMNDLFLHVAERMAGDYRAPWLWLEPDCVPVREDWIERLGDVYYSQPKRYVGPHLKIKENTFLSKVALYPVGAIHDLKKACGESVPFWVAGSAITLPKSTKTRIVQHGVFVPENGLAQIRPETVLYHSDKTQMLIEFVRAAREAAVPHKHGEEGATPSPATLAVEVRSAESVNVPVTPTGGVAHTPTPPVSQPAKRKPGRPKKQTADEPALA